MTMFDNLKVLYRKFKPGLRAATRQATDEYDTGEFTRTLYMLTSTSVVAVLLVSAIAVLASVVFSPQGLAGLVAQLYANLCQTQKVCDLGLLQAGFATALVTMFGLLLLLGMAFERMWLFTDNPLDELYQAVNVLADEAERAREQHQTLMAMLFIVAQPAERTRIADMFVDTLDDEESEALLGLLKEHADSFGMEEEEVSDGK